MFKKEMYLHVIKPNGYEEGAAQSAQDETLKTGGGGRTNAHGPKISFNIKFPTKRRGGNFSAQW